MPTKPLSIQRDLWLAYSPGVADPCLDIEADPSEVHEYSSRGNLLAVIINGAAVLDLGDIGPLAAKPAMGRGHARRCIPWSQSVCVCRETPSLH